MVDWGTLGHCRCTNYLLFPSIIAGHVPSIFMAHLIYLIGNFFLCGWATGYRLHVQRANFISLCCHVFSLEVTVKAVARSSKSTLTQPLSSSFFWDLRIHPPHGQRPLFYGPPLPYYHRSASPCHRPPIPRHPRIILLLHDSGPSGWIEVVVRPPWRGSHILPACSVRSSSNLVAASGERGWWPDRRARPVAASPPLAGLQSLSFRSSVHVAPTAIHGFQLHPAYSAIYPCRSLAISPCWFAISPACLPTRTTVGRRDPGWFGNRGCGC